MKDLIKQIYETHDIREEKPQWAGHLNPFSYTHKAKTFSRPLRVVVTAGPERPAYRKKISMISFFFGSNILTESGRGETPGRIPREY
jgi:hypothetical protein